MNELSVPCWVYRSNSKEGMYLYLSKEEDFECVPDVLKKGMGRLEFSMRLELTPGLKLARENPVKIMASLKEQGFHLQMPPKDFLPDMYYGD